MRWIVLIFLYVYFAFSAKAADPLKVGLFYNQSFIRSSMSVQSGQLELYCDDTFIGVASEGDLFDISAASGTLQLIFKGGVHPAQSSVKVISKVYSNYKIQPVGLKQNNRVYEGNLICVRAPGRIQLVNVLNLESYVPGVIEAEGGSKHGLEYYKVQAIISRTYASSNRRRHEAEGFHLCDATHCQVYHGIPRHEPLTKVATQETEDIVIVDSTIDLITAAFHSNCGGHTINAEDAWSKPLSYCVGRPDTFCLVMPNSNWEKSVSASSWNSYIREKSKSKEDSLLAGTTSYFPVNRQYYFADSSLKIPNKVIRHDFKLKSAYFTVHQDADKVTFIGQGFGHGVGLCQEGAIRMARLGFRYDDIIHFYYKDVHLVPLRFIWFFKEE